MKDLFHNLSIAEALAGTNITGNTDTDGATVDMQGYESVMFAVQVGPYTDGDYEVVVEEAADDGTGSPDTWSAVDDADLHGTESTLSQAEAFKIGYRGIKRFVRIKITSTNVSTGAYLSALAVQGNARRKPDTTQSVT